jgi:Pathogenicity locus
MPHALQSVPNIGPAVAAKLERIGIARPEQLRGRDAEELYDLVSEQEGRRGDPCLLDTFVAAVAYAETGDARPWWEFSRERKARAAAS